MDDYEEIKKLEMELAGPATRKDANRLSLLISNDFEEFGSSGQSYNKSDILKLLSNSELVPYKLTEFVFKRLSNDCILVKYKCTSIDKSTFRTSIWIKSTGNWQVLYHQATVIPNAFNESFEYARKKRGRDAP